MNAKWMCAAAVLGAACAGGAARDREAFQATCAEVSWLTARGEFDEALELIDEAAAGVRSRDVRAQFASRREPVAAAESVVRSREVAISFNPRRPEEVVQAVDRGADRLGVALLCIELGLLHEAVTRLEAMDDPDARIWLARIESMTLPGAEEVLARQYIEYVARLVQVRRLQWARDWIPRLGERFAGVASFREAQEDLPALMEFIEAEIARETVALDMAQIEETWARLSRVPDDSARTQAWTARFLISNGRIPDAIRAAALGVDAEGSHRERCEAAEYYLIASTIHGRLRRRDDPVREIGRRLSRSDYGNNWAEIVRRHEAWLEARGGWEPEIERLQSVAMEALSVDELWVLGDLLQRSRYAYMESRAPLVRLIARFPDHDRVMSGDAMALLAEASYQCGAYEDALRLADQYWQRYRQGPWVETARLRRDFDIPSEMETLGLTE